VEPNDWRKHLVSTVDQLTALVNPGWPSVDAFVAITDPVTNLLPSADRYIRGAAASHVVVDRPTMAEAEAITDLVSRTGVTTLVGIGSGVALDTVKLAAFLVNEKLGTQPVILAIPCGPEPYRAITGFSMYDDHTNRSRKALYEPWFCASRVFVIADLLEEVDPRTVALFAGDSLVHAIESMLSRLNNTESEAHARISANIFVDQAFAVKPQRTLLVEASMRAAVAFESTKLGLAHAMSRPMGISTGTSHDSFNLMMGAPVIEFWGDEVIRASSLAHNLALKPIANLWIEILDHYQTSAGLPESLSGTLLTWSDIEDALDWAPQSTGIPNLPRRLEDGDLLRLAKLAWVRNHSRRRPT
jgi:alcohol dehydrogenase class IV